MPAGAGVGVAVRGDVASALGDAACGSLDRSS